MAEKFIRKQSIDDLQDCGDYCIAGEKTIMNCPKCNVTFSCNHQIVSADPLTLAPSVVGPKVGFVGGSQVMGPCHHHFWVRDGVVVDVF